MLEGRYRQLTELGAFQLGAYVTHSSRIGLDPLASSAPDRNEGIRAYLEGSGKFQLDPQWSITASGRYVTDRTFLRRYDISRDVRLRAEERRGGEECVRTGRVRWWRWNEKKKI